MAIIPPNWISSIAGTPAAHQDAEARRAREAAGQAERSTTGAFAHSLQNVIENADRDGQVYADSEGLGSQGRQPAEQNAAPELPPETDTDRPESSLDIQA
jgi:hypothetical protein